MPKPVRKAKLAVRCVKLLDVIIEATGRDWITTVREELAGEFTPAEIDWAAAHIRPAINCGGVLQDDLIV